MGKPILSEDLQLNTFPLTTSNFSDFVTDRELKRFSVLHLKLHELMDEKDILKLQDTHNNNKGIVQELPPIMNIEQLLDQVRPLIPSIRHQLQALSFMTLWELYKFITITLQIKFPIDNLRNILSLSSFGMNDLEFYYLNLPNDTDLFASSDGIRIKQIVNNNFNSKDYFNSYLLCNCHCIHNDDQKINDDDHEINEAYDTFNTFDLYSQQTFSSSSPILTCCDLETCLVPHLIVYKLKYQLWSDISFTESSTTRRTTTKTPSRQQQQQDKGQNSDVTFDVISNLKNIWDEE